MRHGHLNGPVSTFYHGVVACLKIMTRFLWMIAESRALGTAEMLR